MANDGINTLSPQTKPPSDGAQQIKIAVSPVLICSGGTSIDRQNLTLTLCAGCRSFDPIPTIHDGLFMWDYLRALHQQYTGTACKSIGKDGQTWHTVHLLK
jgi:hypothetical protein